MYILCWDLTLVRQYLGDKAAILVAIALVSGCFDYCNSLFRNLFSFNMHKLLCIENILPRIVTKCNRYTRASYILKHLLPTFELCYIFKMAALVYKFLHNGYVNYFGSLLCIRCEIYGPNYNWPDKRFNNYVHL